MDKSTFEKKKIMIAGVLMIFGYGLINNTLGFFVTPVSEALGCSRAAFNLYYSISCITSLFAAPVFGQMLQKRNARMMILTGLIVGGISFTAFAFCRRIQMFYAVAFFLGMVQQGATSVTAVVLINRAYKENAGSVTGLVMTGTGICSVSMSLVLPVFIERFGWQSAYLLEGALWLAVMFAAFILTKNTVEYPTEQADRTAENPLEDGMTLSQAMRGIVLYLLFLCFAVQGVCTIVVQHIPSFLTEIGKSTAEASVVMSIFSAVLIVGKILLGILFDRMGAVKSLLLNFLAMAFSMWMMIQGGFVLLIAGVIFMGFGMASITVLFPLVTRSVFGNREYASIWGVMSMAISLGTACGSPMWGAVYDVLGSYRPAFAVMPLIVLINGAVIVWAMTHCGTVEK